MQRKPTNTTRGPNAAEKRFQAWVKQQPCIGCGAAPPPIADHMYGATFKHNKVLIGHWAQLPYCQACDALKTHHGRAAHDEVFGPQAQLWLELIKHAPEQPPPEVIEAVRDWGK